MKNRIQLIVNLLEEANALSYNDGNLDKVKKRSEMISKKVFGDETEYADKLKKIKFSPSIVYSGMSDGVNHSSFQRGKNELINLLNVMLEDLNLTFALETNEKSENTLTGLSKNIFIVHGHNEEMKLSTARAIEKLKLNPIILHEQPNKGKTIIEKFTSNSDVAFAIVLLSADDIAYSKNSKAETAMFRARQNVIFELGYFIGKLGRERVIALHEVEDKFEIPSDYSGVIFAPFDKAGKWKFDLVKELKEVGINVDANDIL